MGWKTVLEGSLKHEAEEIINSIASKTKDVHSDEYGVGLMGGTSGILLFESYLSQYRSLNSHINSFGSKINDIVDNFSVASIPFGHGALGLCWLLSHLEKNKELDLPVGFFDEVKESILLKSENEIKSGNYDYLLAGGGAVLWLDEIKDKNGMVSLFDALKSVAIVKDSYCKWVESWILRKPNNDEEASFNLGLAHGIPSILVLLCIIYKKTKNQVCMNLIKGTVSYLLENKLPAESKSVYSFSVYSEQVPQSTPLRWCYGDLGVSVAIYLAGIFCLHKDWQEQGLSIAKLCIHRNSESSEHTEAHLCHGTAGVAHIYNRFYNYTGDKIFKEASSYWYKETLSKFDDTFLYGFKALDLSASGWDDYPGLLEGSSGIGLSLISAISDIEPKWDRCLLLS